MAAAEHRAPRGAHAPRGNTSGRRSGGWATRGALLLVAIAASLLLAELVLRLLPATTLGFVYESGRFRKPPEFTRDDTRNAAGFHDVDHAAKAPGTRRLLLLGDSYVEAGSVSVAQTPGRCLEQHLRAAPGPAWEVVAVGRSGWSPREELAALRERAGALEPDLVVTLFLALNDVRESSPALTAEVRAQQHLAELRPGWSVLRGEAAPLFLVPASRLNQLLSHRLARRLARDDDASIPVDYLVYATARDPRWEAAWRAALAQLDEMRALAERHGARFALVSASTPQGVLGPDAGLAVLTQSYPAMRRRDFDLDLPDRRLAAWTSERGIPFLALEPGFREATARGERLHWRFDGHWNALGNDRAAERIAAFVREIAP